MDEPKAGHREDVIGQPWPGPGDRETLPGPPDVGDHVRVGLEDLEGGDLRPIDGYGHDQDPVADPSDQGGTTMRRSNYRVLAIPAVLAAGMLAAMAAPVQAVNVPDGGAVPPGRVSVIHFRILEGCEGQATDGLELAIPESVTQVIPEAVPGWSVETETVDRDGTPEVSVVRWIGGPLPDALMLEFGLRAVFPDEPGTVVEFPAVQRCSTTMREWSGSDEETPAPIVRIAERLGAQDLIALGDAVAELSLTVEELGARLGDVDAPNLRSRVSELESSLEDIASTLEDLDGRLSDLESGAAS